MPLQLGYHPSLWDLECGFQGGVTLHGFEFEGGKMVESSASPE